MEIICLEKDFVVCVKPAGVLSTDEPGGLPELVRAELGDMKADVATNISTDNFGASVLVQATDRIANDAGVKVADVKDFEGIRVAIFADDDLTGICVG